MTKPVWILAVALAGSVTLAAQNRPVFHAQANYVEVDAVATDKNGHFVPGLTASDFEVSEDGAPQAIETFTLVDLPIGPGVSSAGTATPARVNPAFHLQPGDLDGRLYLIFLDPNAGIVPLRAAGTLSQVSAFGYLDVRKRARQFITDFLQPGDLAAVWNTESGNTQLTFTTDRAELLRAVDDGRGRPVGGQMGQLRDAIDLLNGIQGRRKSLILLTEGSPLLVTQQEDPVTGALSTVVLPWLGGLTPPQSGSHPLPLLWDVPQLDITGRADVHIYTFDTRGLVAPGADAASTPPRYSANNALDAADRVNADANALMLSTMQLSSIASETGGLSFINSNDFKKGFRQIVEDNSRYYVLGYYSPRQVRDGRFIHLSVTSPRKDVQIRARKGYVAR